MIIDKIKSQKDLKEILENLKRQGRTIVFTNGCFDILHYGHVKYLEDAKAEGDILVVAVNSDDSLKKIKGSGRPIINEADRLRMIAALESVDYVLLFCEDTPLKAIEDLKPDMLVKGEDWVEDKIVGSGMIKNSGGRVVRIPLVKDRSTSGIISKIKKKK